MKILKLPVDTKISCDCGCEFEFDIDDVQTQACIMCDNRVYSRLIIDCPFCRYKHIIQEKITEPEVES